MYFKFVILALVVSTSTGDQTVSQKLEPTNQTSNPLPVASSKTKETISNIHENLSNPMETLVKTVLIENETLEHSTPPQTDKTVEPPTTKLPSPPPNTTTSTVITSNPPPTTTPIPTTANGTWSVKNKTGDVCILAKMDLEVNLTYVGTDSKTYSETIFVPENSTANGTCSDVRQNIILNWEQGNSFEIDFGLNKTTGKYEITALSLTVNLTESKEIPENLRSVTLTKDKPEIFSAPLKMSYKCDKKQKVFMEHKVSNTTNATLFISHTQLQAFMIKPDHAFADAKDCEGFDTPDIVPIAVGCVLSILVIVVLVAYMIGRRRSQNRGYLSICRHHQ